MNLRNIANSLIQVINPDQSIKWMRSIGYTVNDDYEQVPAYETLTVKANVQSMGDEQLQQMNNLNISGVLRTVYMSSNAMGISFKNIRGGDLLEFSEFEGEEPTVWKVVHVNETWSNWCSVTAQQQKDD